MANQMIRNMRQEELRNLSNPGNTIPNINTNTTISQSSHNYRYQQRLDNIQSITDNIGIIYQDEKDDTIQIETQTKYHNLRIYSQDRKWCINTSDTFYNITINLGISQTDKLKEHIQISNSYQNIISIYSTNIIIPNIFIYQQQDIPHIIHIKINNYTFTTTSNNTEKHKSQLLHLSKNSKKTDTFLNYICLEKELLTLDNNNNVKMDITSGLSINILNQYENPLCNNLQDTINIKTINFNTVTGLIDIYFTNYLIPCIWKKDNTIIIQKYKFRETDLDYEECYTWNNFINIEEGHKIKVLDIYPINGTIMTKCKKLSIDTPFLFNQETGELEIPEWFSNLLLKTNIDTLPNVNQECKGSILNLNLQTVIQLQIQTLEKKIKRTNQILNN